VPSSQHSSQDSSRASRQHWAAATTGTDYLAVDIATAGLAQVR
jgi:hypothetical protein